MQLMLISKNNFNKKAFTLAEVLITLGVIGVVAAITIPTLIQNAEERAYISGLKKSYSTISNAYNLAVKDNGTPDSWNLTANPSPNILDTLKPHLNVAKDCIDGSKGCWPNGINYKSLDPNPSYYAGIYDNDSYPKLRLNDGTSIYGRVWATDCTRAWGLGKALQNICGEYYIDINGDKKPNQWGKDVFSFWITKYGISPRGGQQNTIYTFASDCNGATGVTQYGASCAGWVLTNENMDYLHCNGLNWNAKTTCN